jgi:lipopolysaccharide transport system ATP-binding protein
VSAFRCGAEAVLHLIIENRTKREFKDFRISLGIDNEMGQRVALLDTLLVGADCSGLSSGHTSVRVIVPRMALIPGRYHLTIVSIITKVIADWVDNAAIFDVEEGDFYNTGQLMLDEQGMFLLDHRFVVNSESMQ